MSGEDVDISILVVEVELAREAVTRFGTHLKQLRTQRRVSVRKLAELIGEDHVMVHRVENGVVVPGPRMLEGLVGWMSHDSTSDGS